MKRFIRFLLCLLIALSLLAFGRTVFAADKCACQATGVCSCGPSCTCEVDVHRGSIGKCPMTSPLLGVKTTTTHYLDHLGKVRAIPVSLRQYGHYERRCNGNSCTLTWVEDGSDGTSGCAGGACGGSAYGGGERRGMFGGPVRRIGRAMMAPFRLFGRRRQACN